MFSMKIKDFLALKCKETGKNIPIETIYTNIARGNINTIGYRKQKRVVVDKVAKNWQPKEATKDVHKRRFNQTESEYFNHKDYYYG